MIHGFLLLFGLMATGAKASEQVSHRLITQIAHQEQIPVTLLKSITQVESAFHPWSLNVAGKTYVFPTRHAAEAFLDQCLQQGQTQIDIGCMQINWYWHGHNFRTPKQLLSPELSLRYAARLLKSHRRHTRSWMNAALLYHSSNPKHQQIYRIRLIQALISGPSV